MPVERNVLSNACGLVRQVQALQRFTGLEQGHQHRWQSEKPGEGRRRAEGGKAGKGAPPIAAAVACTVVVVPLTDAASQCCRDCGTADGLESTSMLQSSAEDLRGCCIIPMSMFGLLDHSQLWRNCAAEVGRVHWDGLRKSGRAWQRRSGPQPGRLPCAARVAVQPAGPQVRGAVSAAIHFFFSAPNAKQLFWRCPRRITACWTPDSWSSESAFGFSTGCCELLFWQSLCHASCLQQ